MSIIYILGGKVEGHVVPLTPLSQKHAATEKNTTVCFFQFPSAIIDIAYIYV